MRIALTLQSFLHQGGIGTYTQQIVPRLLAMDTENEYILIYPSFGQSYKALGQFKDFTHVTEVTSKSLVPHGIYWDQLVIPAFVRKYNIDLFFNPFQSVPIRGRFKKVLTMHNSEWFIMPEVFGYIEKFNGKVLLKPIMQSADIVISVSQKVANDLMEATGISNEKFKVVYNGKGENFKPITDTDSLSRTKEKYQLPDDFILFVGGIYPQKNFSGLMQAYSLMAHDSSYSLVIAGHGRWKSKQDLNLIQDLNLENKVRMLGWVDHDDLPAIYNLATCFVIPSFHESCSVALLEALSCGCPVVASNTGGNPEVVADAALLIDPHNPHELKEALSQVLCNANLRQQLSQKGLKRAKHFTWEQCAKETLEILNECGS